MGTTIHPYTLPYTVCTTVHHTPYNVHHTPYITLQVYLEEGVDLDKELYFAILLDRKNQGVWCMVYGVWCMVYGVRCTVYGVRCTVYGVRCVVYGVWCMLCGV